MKCSEFALVCLHAPCVLEGYLEALPEYNEGAISTGWGEAPPPPPPPNMGNCLTGGDWVLLNGL